MDAAVLPRRPLRQVDRGVFGPRSGRGRRPSVEDDARAHPSLRTRSARCFPTIRMMEELKPGSGESTGSFDSTGGGGSGALPEQFGDLRPVRELGHGGMGVVYEAEQVSLGRRVGLKVMKPGMLKDAKDVQRFKAEARAAGSSSHQHRADLRGR